MTLAVGLSHCFVAAAGSGQAGCLRYSFPDWSVRRRADSRNDTFVSLCSMAYAAAYNTDFADATDFGRLYSIESVKSA